MSLSLSSLFSSLYITFSLSLLFSLSFSLIHSSPDVRGTSLYDSLDEVDDLLNSPKHKYLSTENFTDSHEWYRTRRYKNFTTVDGDSFEKDYSQLYTMEICEDELEFEKLYAPLIEGADKQFDAQHLFFITV